MSVEIRWLDRRRIDAIHEQSIAIHGGSHGLRDESALLAGLMRAQNLYAYGNPPPDLADLAAIYAGGIVLNHPFVDGNKRTGFLAAYLLIVKNGYTLEASEAETVLWTLKLAAHACEEKDYAGWLRANMKKARKPAAVIARPKANSAKKKPRKSGPSSAP